MSNYHVWILCDHVVSSCVDGEDDNEYCNFLLSTKYSETSLTDTNLNIIIDIEGWSYLRGHC